MSNSVVNPRVDVSQWEPKFPFDLVVAYEDTQTRNRALHLYDHLAQQLLDDYDFQCSWWKFDHFVNSAIREQAGDAAADANMVVLSLQARKEMLPMHQAWIEDWLPRRENRKSALVALIAGNDEALKQADGFLNYLRRAARLGHMDFFNHAFDLSQPPREILLKPPTEPVRLPPNMHQSLLYQQIPTPRWGINE